MHQSYEEKRSILKAVGWMEASGGEWWPPPFIQVPTMTTSFNTAYDLTKSLALSQRDKGYALSAEEIKTIVNGYFDGGSNG
jgi:hypothetical protein